MKIEAGTTVALVGVTGSGKSTLARLLAGLYEPTSGRILFDGQDLTALDRRSVRRQLGVVTQDTQLFSVSLRRNIALASPDAGLEAIIRAARLACIHDDIEGRPMRYETILADNGLSLSGGQRQRLALARAVVREPKVLVLDEATSHLDAVTEAAIGRNLRRLRCTQISVAHRLSTIRHADQILVMEAGRIVERGQHDALMARRGVYATLFSAQVDGLPQPVRETHARS